MKELNCKLKNLVKFTILISVPFLCILMVTMISCKKDDTNPVDPLVAGTGVPLHILGPQPYPLTGSISQSNQNDFRIDATTLMAAGGNPLAHYTWTISNLSSFPSGTTVDPQTGIFKWTGASTHLPAGSYPFNMTVSDGSTTVTASYVLTLTTYSILPTLMFQQPAISSFRLDTAIAGKSYGSSLFVTVGSSGPTKPDLYLPLNWTLASGQLPGGLVIDQQTGIVRGTPLSNTSGQNYSFTVEITNSNNEIASCYGAGCVLYNLYVK